MATHPALLSHNLIGQSILPDGFSCGTKLNTYVSQGCLTIFRKIHSGTDQSWKNAFSKQHVRLFCRKFLENFKISRKPLENDFGQISQQILSGFSDYFPFCHLIDYSLTRLLVLNANPSVFTYCPCKLSPYFKTLGSLFHSATLTSG